MGGVGSGRLPGYIRKLTVEDCLALRVSDLLRAGMLDGAAQCRYLGGESVEGAQPGRSVTIDIVPAADRFSGRLLYRRIIGDEPYDVEQVFVIVGTRQHFGGTRWWFECPAARDGQPCSRRVGGLFLAPEQTFFGCRHCRNLTYLSRRQ
jgi:hypothetical protein